MFNQQKLQQLEKAPIPFPNDVAPEIITIIRDERRQTLDELAVLLNSGNPSVEQLILFLTTRWQRIQGTPVEYFRFPFHPVNRACEAIAKYVCQQMEENVHYFELLVPTLKVTHFDVTQEDLREDDADADERFSVHDFLSNDAKDALIVISDVFSGAIDSAKTGKKSFVHSYTQNSTSIALTDNEILQLRYSCPEAERLHASIDAHIESFNQTDGFATQLKMLAEQLYTCGVNVGRSINELLQRRGAPDYDYPKLRAELVRRLLDKGANEALLLTLLKEAEQGRLENLGNERQPSPKIASLIQAFHQSWQALEPGRRLQLGAIAPSDHYRYTLDIILFRLFSGAGITLSPAEEEKAKSVNIHTCVELNSRYLQRILRENLDKLDFFVPDYDGLFETLRAALLQRQPNFNENKKGMQQLACAMWPLLRIKTLQVRHVQNEFSTKIDDYLKCILAGEDCDGKVIAWFLQNISQYSDSWISHLIKRCHALQCIPEQGLLWLRHAVLLDNFHLVYSLVKEGQLSLLEVKPEAIDLYPWLAKLSEFEFGALVGDALIKTPTHFTQIDASNCHLGHYLLARNRPSMMSLFIEKLRKNESASHDWLDVQDADAKQTLLHLATYFSATEIVIALVDMGADWRLQTNDGKTALALARAFAVAEDNHSVVQYLKKLQDDYEALCQTDAAHSKEREAIIQRWPLAQWQLTLKDASGKPITLWQHFLMHADFATWAHVFTQERLTHLSLEQCYPKKVLAQFEAAIEAENVERASHIATFFKARKIPFMTYRKGDEPEALKVLTESVASLVESTPEVTQKASKVIDRHTLCIYNLPNGDLVSGSDDNTLWIWHKDEAGDFQCVQVLQGHEDQVWSLTTLPNGDLVSGSRDRTLRIWRKEKEAGEFQFVQVLKGHEGPVRSLTTLPNGDLVSGSWDNTLRIWRKNESGRFQFKQVLRGHEDSVNSLTTLPNGDLVSGSDDNTLRIWRKNEAGRFQFKQALQGHEALVSSLTTLPNGDLVSGSWDRTLRIWRKNESGRFQFKQVLEGHESLVTSLTPLPNGDLVSGDYWDSFRIWRKNESGRFQFKQVLEGYRGCLLSNLTTLPNGDLLTNNGRWELQSIYLSSFVNALQCQDKAAIAAHLTIPCLRQLLGDDLINKVNAALNRPTPVEAICLQHPDIAQTSPEMATFLFELALSHPSVLGSVLSTQLHLATALHQIPWLEDSLAKTPEDALTQTPCNALGQTPLHLAVHADVLAVFCDKGPVSWLNQPDNQGYTPLHLAAQCTDHDAVNRVMQLVHAGANWRLNVNDKTALTLARNVAVTDINPVVQCLESLQEDYEALYQIDAVHSEARAAIIQRWPMAQWQLTMKVASGKPATLWQHFLMHADIATWEYIFTQECLTHLSLEQCYPKKVLAQFEAAIEAKDVERASHIVAFFKAHKIPFMTYRKGDEPEALKVLTESVASLVESTPEVTQKASEVIDRHTLCIYNLPNGDLVSGSSDNTLRIWRKDEAGNFQCVQIWQGHEGQVNSLTILPNGDLVSGSSDNTVRIWRKDEAGDFQCVQVLKGHESWVRSLTTLPNGDLVSGSGDCTLRIWRKDEAGDFQCVQVLKGHESWVRSLTTLPNGDLVSGSSDKTLRIWRKDEAGDFQCVQVLKGHESWVFDLTILPNGDLVSGSGDCTLRIWRKDEAGEFQCVQVLQGHKGSVFSLTTLPNGELVSCSGDQTLRIWRKDEAGEFQCVQVLKGHENMVRSLTTLPNGDLLTNNSRWELQSIYLSSFVNALQCQDKAAIAAHLTIPCLRQLIGYKFISEVNAALNRPTPVEAICLQHPDIAQTSPEMATFLFELALSHPSVLGSVLSTQLHLATALHQIPWLEDSLAKTPADALTQTPCNALGQTPLHLAAHADVLAVFCDKGPVSWLNQPDNQGYTPLHLAAQCTGDDAVNRVMQLVHAGANWRLNVNGETALTLARCKVVTDDNPVVQCLEKLQSDYEALCQTDAAHSEEREAIIELWPLAQWQLTMEDASGKSTTLWQHFLMHADFATWKHVFTQERLITNLDIDWLTLAEQESPERLAILFGLAENHPQLLELLGENIGSLLHFAVILNQIDWIQNYLQQTEPGELNQLPKNNLTQNPLHVAIKYGHQACIDLLKSACPQWLQETDVNGRSPIDSLTPAPAIAEALGNSMTSITNPSGGSRSDNESNKQDAERRRSCVIF